MSKPRLRGLRAAGRAYRVSPSTIHKWIESGALDARHVKGEGWRIKRDPVSSVRERASEYASAVKLARVRMAEPLTVKRERELGLPPRTEPSDSDTRSLAVTVFAPIGKGATFDAAGPRNAVLARLAAVLGGKVRKGGRGSRSYQGEIVFSADVTEAQIASALSGARLPKSILRGGRLQLGLKTQKGVYVPLSYAYAQPNAAMHYAIGSLLRGALMLGDTGRNRAARMQRARDRRAKRRSK